MYVIQYSRFLAVLSRKETESAAFQAGATQHYQVISQVTVTKSIGSDMCSDTFEAGKTFKNQTHAYTWRHPCGEQEKKKGRL